MTHVSGLRCVRCAKEHALPGVPGAALQACTICGGNLAFSYDMAALARAVSRERFAADRDRSLWRYRAFLPVDVSALDAIAPDASASEASALRGSALRGSALEERLAVGGTPLARAPVLGRRLGLAKLWLKDETRHPSGSLKDRAGALVLAAAHARGERVVAVASTGNAASSLACLAARTGMRTVIFVPVSAPEAKLAQILLCGATVIAVRGTYDQAFELCAAACREFGWYNRSTGLNPFTREGKKTCAFEIAEQLGWRVPDVVAVSVGDGNILSGLWKGFVELRAAGLVERVPRLLAAQAQHSNAVQLAFEGDGVLRPVSGVTLADSISVSLPRDGDAAVAALREARGLALTVSDDEILEAMRATARDEGLCAEPAAAASIAALGKAVREGQVGADDVVVAVVTGSGLKDVASAVRAAGAPHVVDADFDTVKQLLRERVAL